MSLKDKIVDYDYHKENADHWIELKGEQKYLEFVKILENKNIPIEWKLLDDLFRYDKRLLVNCFKYLSFFEEFLRAQIWNISQDSYKKIEDMYLLEVIEEVINLEDKMQYQKINLQYLKVNKIYINYLRNRVMHNKIIINSIKDNKDLRELLIFFKNCLPESYKNGFMTDINNCRKGLNLVEKLIIKI